MIYTTPDFGGANVTIGIFDPLNSLTEPGTAAVKSAPGFHGKLAWSTKFSDTMNLSMSGTFITQKQDYVVTGTAASFNSTGGDSRVNNRSFHT